jgi:hypothetical protein
MLESKQDEAYDNGYDNGYKEGGWLKVKCSKCHKELNFDIHDKKDNAKILKFLDYQFHHVECPNANSLRDNTSITVPATLTILLPCEHNRTKRLLASVISSSSHQIRYA